MIEVGNGKTMQINLREDANGRDWVALTLPATGCAFDLTPHQARVLATELIVAVNRAEVRRHLKRGPTTALGPVSDPEKRGLFRQTFAK
ncbi:MAG TPA: hypothetical protein PKC12_04505 [Thiobacillaceae bacterium]|nr:hypothetical protein [Thiobacillaceae bacterium]